MAAETTIARENKAVPLSVSNALGVSRRTLSYGRNAVEAISNRAIEMQRNSYNPSNLEQWVRNAGRITRATNNMLARELARNPMSSTTRPSKKQVSEEEAFVQKNKNASFIASIKVGRSGVTRFFTSKKEYTAFRNKAWESGHDLESKVLKGKL